MARLEVAGDLRALQVVMQLQRQEVDDSHRGQQRHLVTRQGGEKAPRIHLVLRVVLPQHGHAEPAAVTGRSIHTIHTGAVPVWC